MGNPEIIDGHKECSVCSRLLELKMFFKTSYSYSSKCRKCTRTHLSNKVGFKVCKACGEEKSFVNFRLNKDGFDCLCKLCRNEHRKTKYHTDDVFRKKHLSITLNNVKKHPKKYAAKLKKWRSENPEKYTKIRKNYRARLPDSYVSELIKHRTNIEYVPLELIKLKRLQIKCKRILKLKENESHRIAQPTIKSTF